MDRRINSVLAVNLQGLTVAVDVLKKRSVDLTEMFV